MILDAKLKFYLATSEGNKLSNPDVFIKPQIRSDQISLYRAQTEEITVSPQSLY